MVLCIRYDEDRSSGASQIAITMISPGMLNRGNLIVGVDVHQCPGIVETSHPLNHSLSARKNGSLHEEDLDAHVRGS